jgi:hypothetical protein
MGAANIIKMENLIDMMAQRGNSSEEISRLDLAAARGQFVVSQEHIAGPVALIVEPDRHTRVAALELLQMEDYQVSTAASRAEAQARAVQNACYLLVTEERISSEESGEQVIHSWRAILVARLRSSQFRRRVEHRDSPRRPTSLGCCKTSFRGRTSAGARAVARAVRSLTNGEVP